MENIVFLQPEKRKEQMEYLPKDPAILVSSINMLLRDEEFDSLESLCYSFNTIPDEVKAYLGEFLVWI